jgi:hypothetical protein
MIKGKPYLVEKEGDFIMWESGRTIVVERDGAYILRRR